MAQAPTKMAQAAHDGSRRPEVVPKMAPRRLKMARDGSRWSQDGFKLAPRLPKMVQRWPKMAPTWLKMAQSGPRLPRSARERTRRPLNAGAWLAEAVNETRVRRTQARGSLSQGTNQMPAQRRRLARFLIFSERRRLARSDRERTRRPQNAYFFNDLMVISIWVPDAVALFGD